MRKYLALALFASCSPTRSTVPAPIAPAAAAIAADHALQLELTPVIVRGELLVRDSDDGDWQPLTAARAGIREIRATRRGAVVALGHGDAAGRLWLRAGARVRLGQDDKGTVHLAMLDGEARLRRTAAQLPVSIGGLVVTGDYLLDSGRTTMMTPTGARPDLAAFSVALDGDDSGAGVGRLDAGPDPVTLAKVTVRVHTEGDVAATEVEHVFHSDATGRPREGTFRFQVPDGAMLTGLAMEIDGKMVEGEIVEREKAREVYDKVVDSMQDPALLEWEQGNWFKLRMFPIVAGADKRVVIRYTTPLVHRPSGWEYDYAVAAPAIGDFTLEVDGTQVAHQTNVAGGLDLAAPIAKVPSVMQEKSGTATYTAIRIAPDASMLGALPQGPRKVAVIFDTSRSTLEGRALADQLLATTLAELAPDDQVAILASDVDVRTLPMAPVDAGSLAAATKFLAAIEPDGASDVGTALAAAAALHPTDVIYVGDGVPTWGEQDPLALGKLADAIGAPIHAALIGKGATTELWGDLAGRSGGRALIVRRADDATRFALVAAHAGDVPKLTDAHVVIAGDAEVFPREAQTIYAGDELVALVKTIGPAPTSIELTGMAAGSPVKREIRLDAPVAMVGHDVARRWGAREIAMLEAHDADRDQIVAVSRELGVLSRFTSLLVLENDEAYKQFQIERTQPQITGGDLDTLGARHANLSPDEIQPGDPEIKIPAPRDAKRVLVTFPFGDTKLAEWDDDVGAWMVRFLIDKDTPDGEYQARITIEHADGRIELMSLPYIVDTKAPVMQLSAKRTSTGYAITAKQTTRYKDADKVEVALPDGTILTLTGKHGTFTGEWTTARLTAPVTLRVVSRDRALNESVQELVVP